MSACTPRANGFGTPSNGHGRDHAEPVRQMHESLIACFEANVQHHRHSRLYTWLSSAACEETAIWTYADVADRSRAVCCAMRRRWGATDGVRVMLVYPPGLDFVVGFLACQYAAVVAVPYYPPIIPPSPTPSDGALKMLIDGLAKLVRVYDSCNPEMLLSTVTCAAAHSPLCVAPNPGPHQSDGATFCPLPHWQHLMFRNWH
jgi:acyl-CoA synthetase (AMP-forming)/AMP-acid ligase II